MTSNLGPRRFHQVNLYKNDKALEWHGQWICQCDDCPLWFHGFDRHDSAESFRIQHEQSAGKNLW